MQRKEFLKKLVNGAGSSPNPHVGIANAILSSVLDLGQFFIYACKKTISGSGDKGSKPPISRRVTLTFTCIGLLAVLLIRARRRIIQD
jgi:hypothetical protein